VVALIAAEISKGGRDRTASFSGSSAGACLRAQEFGFLGVEAPFETLPSADLIGIYDDGRWRHLRWQANLLTAGLLTHIEFPLDWPAKRSKGSMDGLGLVKPDHPNIRWRGLSYGFELKGMHGYPFARIAKQPNPKPLDKHLNQVQRYFLVSGVDLFVVVYECKLTQRTLEWVIEPDAAAMEEQMDELEALNAAVDARHVHGQLQSCERRKGPAWEACPYAGRGGICETWRDRGTKWR
jgi:hypothetical protein